MSTRDEKPDVNLIDGRYVLAPEKRQGGMSVVQKAYDRQEDRFCAIKRITLSLAPLPPP